MLLLLTSQLVKAVVTKDIELVKTALESGANIHADDDYALRFSAEKGHIEVVKLLLESGANIHAGADFALRFSAEKGHIEVVKLLLEHY